MRKSIAHKSKTFDQFLLLIAGLAMSACAFWVWSVMDHRRIPNRMGFFIVLNILTGFVLTCSGAPGILGFSSELGGYSYLCLRSLGLLRKSDRTVRAHTTF